MAKVITEESNLTNIANAIRSKTGRNESYLPSEMAAAIQGIESYPEPTGTQTITENGIVSVKDKEFAEVDVQATATLVSKTITQNGSYDAEDDEADGYSEVTVDVPNSYTAADEGKVVSEGELVAQSSQTITKNGTYDTTLIDEAVINVSGGGSSDFLYGKDEPTASLGSVGDIYIQCDGALPYDSTEQRTYVLNITEARRGNQDNFSYASASEIDLIFVDSEGVEHSIRDVSDFSYSASKQNSRTPISYAFDGDPTTHWEGNPKPITITMAATIPSGYTPSELRVMQRSGDSYTSDVWKTFNMAETTGGDATLLLNRSDLTVEDWAGAYEWTMFDVAPMTTVIAAFKKVDATTWEKTVPAGSSYNVADTTHEGGGEAFFSNIASPSNGGNAPSGTTQIISVSEPVDLTELTSLVFKCFMRDLDTRTSNGMRFGVAQTVPQSWSEVTAARNVYVDATGDKTLDVTELSGDYYLFYASQITYSQGARAIAAFTFPKL